MADENRYAKDWNQYSRNWDCEYGERYGHLGDEWNDDATAARKRDEYYFAILAERFVNPQVTALEVGPGGGKWTVRLARRVKKLFVLDVAQEMLRRTEERCRQEGLTNIEYVLGNGRDFQPIADGGIDFFFSYDVFVHIALEDTFSYVHEMNRVLRSGGRGACHHAVSSVPQAFSRIEQNNEWYRGGKNTLGQYFYYSPESLRRMYEHCGLQVHEQHIVQWHCTNIFEKTFASPLPDLERLLWQLISPEAADKQHRQSLLAALRQLPGKLDEALQPVLEKGAEAEDHWARIAVAEEIRRLWRGIGGYIGRG